MTQRGGKWMGFAVAGATLLVYLPAVFNNFVEWDDALIITSNPRFNPSTWGTVVYYCTHAVWNLYMPVTCMLWAALARLGRVGTPDAMGTQMDPYVFHLAQVAIFAGLIIFLQVVNNVLFYVLDVLIDIRNVDFLIHLHHLLKKLQE